VPTRSAVAINEVREVLEPHFKAGVKEQPVEPSRVIDLRLDSYGANPGTNLTDALALSPLELSPLLAQSLPPIG
jgi:hypothetical protein